MCRLTKNLDTAAVYSSKAKEAIRLFGISSSPPTVIFRPPNTKKKLLGLFVDGGSGHSHIFLNPRALMAAPSFTEDLVAHELAHWVCKATGVDDGETHGEAWRRVCERLGGAAEALSHAVEFRDIWTPQPFHVWDGGLVEEYLTQDEHDLAVSLKGKGERIPLRSYTGRRIML